MFHPTPSDAPLESSLGNTSAYLFITHNSPDAWLPFVEKFEKKLVLWKSFLLSVEGAYHSYQSHSLGDAYPPQASSEAPLLDHHEDW